MRIFAKVMLGGVLFGNHNTLTLLVWISKSFACCGMMFLAMLLKIWKFSLSGLGLEVIGLPTPPRMPFVDWYSGCGRCKVHARILTNIHPCTYDI